MKVFLLISLFTFISSIKIPTLPLLNDKEIPVLGLGTGLTQGDAVYNEIKIGFDAGFRHIDTADNYSNQKDIGRTLKEIFSKGEIKREEVFLTSKVSIGSLTRNGTHQVVGEALRDLGVDYIDLFLLHSSSGVRENDVESYRALEDEIDSGRILGAGLSNWNVSYAQDFWDLARHKPVNIQNRSHPKHLDADVVEWCKAKKVIYTAYTPLKNSLNDPNVVEIASHYNKSSAQVLLKFQLQRGVITIPDSAKESHIRQNVDVFDFEINDDDFDKLNSL